MATIIYFFRLTKISSCSMRDGNSSCEGTAMEGIEETSLQTFFSKNCHCAAAANDRYFQNHELKNKSVCLMISPGVLILGVGRSIKGIHEKRETFPDI